jgi:hypothetical protein
MLRKNKFQQTLLERMLRKNKFQQTLLERMLRKNKFQQTLLERMLRKNKFFINIFCFRENFLEFDHLTRRRCPTNLWEEFTRPDCRT